MKQINPFQKIVSLLEVRIKRQKEGLVESQLQLESAVASAEEWEMKQAGLPLGGQPKK